MLKSKRIEKSDRNINSASSTSKKKTPSSQKFKPNFSASNKKSMRSTSISKAASFAGAVSNNPSGKPFGSGDWEWRSAGF